MERLFRGKSKETGEWLYGDLIHGLNDEMYIRHIVIGWSQEEAKVTMVDKETVGQLVISYDGLKLFVGDICILSAEECLDTDQMNLDYDWSVKMKLVYNSENCVFWFVDEHGCVITFGDLAGCDADIEVIGNIHENK